jgi:O-methyltransferase
MSAPTKEDIHIYSNETAEDISERDYNKDHSRWCNASLEEVKNNMSLTEYPSSNIFYIMGMVEDTLQVSRHEKIALLRLDTDFYNSTMRELIHLYPMLSKNGVLLVDDYGFWSGQKIAVDEYFESKNINILLHRIDPSGRVAIKN